ncbi:MAG TPA: monovalent cation/H+ antiporter subunit D [Quisquiliibacterium sp.]|nr:monovalent cation/H+ antiporter subunit D [Quisquiliibacterium sp.]
MSHWIVAPVVWPLFFGALLVLVERRAPRLQAPLSVLACAGLLVIALRLLAGADTDAVEAYLLGNWPAPFSIVLVLDRLSALMLVLLAVLACACMAFALGTRDRAPEPPPHFHPLFQFQLMGLGGAFLTGDLFNLFVFFELLLIASYGLLLHGGGALRARAGLHYVSFNLAASALFLIAVSLLYGVTGSLGMADLAQAMSKVAPEDEALVRAAAGMLLVVFFVKAALLPLYFWLPDAYGAAVAPVAALFAIMTKVGVYAVLRVTTLIFGAEGGAAADVAQPWLAPLAIASLALASLGALAATGLRQLAAYLVIASAATLLAAIGLAGPASISAALYYLVHSTLVGAAMFLLAQLVSDQRGPARDRVESGPRVAQPALLGALFFVAAVSVGGLPPLSGFVGKAAILQSALLEPPGAAAAPWGLVWAVMLGGALVVIIALSRAGSRLFWNTRAAAAPAGGAPRRAGPGQALPVVALLAAGVSVALFAAPVLRYTAAAAGQLLEPARYVDSVNGQRPVVAPGGPK